MRPNAQVQYVDGSGRLTIAGLQLIDSLARAASRGFVAPGMTEAERDALTVQDGLLIFNADTAKLNVWTGAAWEEVTSA